MIRLAARASVIGIWLATFSVASSAEDRLPNIVLIVADDLGYGDVGCYGAKDIRTPHLDRMAAEGTRLTSFLVAQPVCTASRAALMTGCYPNRISLFGALNHESNVGIADSELLLPEICRQRGYATAIFGKWHLGHREKFLPTNHGFDRFLGLPYSNDNGPLHPIVRTIPPLPLIENTSAIEHDPDQSQFTKRFTDKAVKFIASNKDRPFFLYLPHVMPHVPIFASEEFRGRSQRGLYGDVVEELDWSVGEILAAIKEHGLDKQTLVIFTSDNGPFLSYGNHAGSAGPLREGKLTTFEGGVRVPCIVRWPGHTKAGLVSEALVASIDLVPTVAKLLRVPLPEHAIDGIDRCDDITGFVSKAPGRHTFLYYAGDELQAVREENWKLHLPHEYLTPAKPAGRNGKPANFANLKPESMQQSGLRGIASRHGYVVERIELSLFDLSKDVGETTNVAAEHPEIVEKLLAIAEEARADLGDSLTKRTGANIRPAGKL